MTAAWSACLASRRRFFTTAAHALDYQFGFKVSETWFYRMLERALGWMILAQFAALLLSTCFVMIQPGDQALLERFGKPVGDNGVIGPGLHLKFPWPIDKVYPPVHTERIQKFTVGAEPEPTRVVQWTVSHGQEQNFLVASSVTNHSATSSESGEGTNIPPVSLLSVSIPVHYLVTNLVAWSYVNEDPRNLLHGLAQREVMHYLAHADFDNLMSLGREQAAEPCAPTSRPPWMAKTSARASFTSVCRTSIRPSRSPKFSSRSSAPAKSANRKSSRPKPTPPAPTLVPAANPIAWWDVALATQHRAMTNAVARAELFGHQMMAYAAAPGEGGIYEQRAYLEALVSSTGKTANTFCPTPIRRKSSFTIWKTTLRPDLIESLGAPVDKK